MKFEEQLYKIELKFNDKILKALPINVLFLLSVLLGKIPKVLYQTYHILGKIIAPYARNTVHLTGTIEYKCVCFWHFQKMMIFFIDYDPE